jgi:hypothetical protein
MHTREREQSCLEVLAYVGSMVACAALKKHLQLYMKPDQGRHGGWWE